MARLWKTSSLLPMQRILYFPPITHSKCFSSSSSSGDGQEDIKSRFDAWAVAYGKSYKTVFEKEKRFDIFREKLRSIEKHNSTRLSCCKRQLTKFSDQTWDDLECTYCHAYIDSDDE